LSKNFTDDIKYNPQLNKLEIDNSHIDIEPRHIVNNTDPIKEYYVIRSGLLIPGTTDYSNQWSNIFSIVNNSPVENNELIQDNKICMLNGGSSSCTLR